MLYKDLVEILKYTNATAYEVYELASIIEKEIYDDCMNKDGFTVTVSKTKYTLTFIKYYDSINYDFEYSNMIRVDAKGTVLTEEKCYYANKKDNSEKWETKDFREYIASYNK